MAALFHQCRLQSPLLTPHNYTRSNRVCLVRVPSHATRFSTITGQESHPTGRVGRESTALVTGASGFLGRKLCGELLNQGFCVKAFDLKTSDISTLHPPPCGGSLQIVYGDVTDYPSLLQAVSGCHVIFHAAAVVGSWIPNPDRFFSVNVGGLKNVLRACKETKTIEKIIYTSSFFALGATDGHVADESQVHHGKYFCTEYEKSKTIADKIALDAASEGVPIVLVYPGFMYGSGKLTDGNSLAILLVERLNGRMPCSLGREKGFSFCHVDDVARAHIAAMIRGRLGERYLLTGENASFKDAFDIAAEITQTPKPWFHIPFFLLELFACFCLPFYRLMRKCPLISPATVKLIKHEWAYSCEKAKRELGYNPRSLKEGLIEMLSWLKSVGLITY